MIDTPFDVAEEATLREQVGSKSDYGATALAGRSVIDYLTSIERTQKHLVYLTFANAAAVAILAITFMVK